MSPSAAGRVRLQKPRQVEVPDEAPRGGQVVPLCPLQVSGVVLQQAALVEALRIYYPWLQAIHVTEDGQHFWLMMGQEGGSHADSAAS